MPQNTFVPLPSKGVGVIHKARVMIKTPGKRWVRDMQARRARIVNAVDLVKFDELDVGELVTKYLSCGGGQGSPDVAIKSSYGQMIDDGRGLEYEFVTYDRARGKIIIAVFIGDDNIGSPILFSNLFPMMHHNERREPDRGFLIVPPVSGFTEGWALQPTGSDRHNEYGFYAT